MLLRGYQDDDLDAMYALDVRCFERPFRFTRRSMLRFAEAAQARVAIAEENSELVGFVMLHIEAADEGMMGYVMTLDVAPEVRRRGIAGALMQEADRMARAANCVALALHVFSGNEAAIRFYERAGFVRSHKVTAFYGRGLDAWVYHKLLRSTDGSSSEFAVK